YSSTLKWLKNSFNLNIPTEEIHFGCGYLSFIIERLKTNDLLLDSLSVLVHTANVPYNNIGCYILPIRTMKIKDENSLGIITAIGIASNNYEYPPSDSMCTFDPQFGQGITHAFRQAKVLKHIFEENQYKLKDISSIYNYRASKISDECWFTSTASNWKTPTLKVIKANQYGQTKIFQRDQRFPNSKEYQLQTPLLIQFIQWYQFWFLQCAAKSGKLSTEFLQIINQCKNPIILFKPLTILTIFIQHL
ncbi:unnamed protein product, partial [Adineta ricciae]